MSEYRRKTKFRFLIPVVIVGLILSVTLLTTSVTMSRQTRHVVDGDTLDLVQLKKPKKGDTVAVIKTSAGSFKAVLYPEYAPKTVENFTNLAKSGYYNDTYIYNIEKGVLFNAGAPNKSGSLDKSKSSGNERQEVEYSQNLWPIKGALYTCTTGTEDSIWKRFMGRDKRYGGSRFGVCNTIEMSDDIKKTLNSDNEVQNKIADAFFKNGGIPNFSGQVTIFGQVYDGMDIVEKITDSKAEEETNYNGNKTPKKDIKIKSIEISKY